MPNSDVVQFKSPTTGQVQPIPPEHWDEAIKAGYKPTSHAVMYSLSGQRGMVPNEEIADHAKQGFQTTPETQFEKDRDPNNQSGALPAIGNALKSTASGIVNAAMAPFKSPGERVADAATMGTQLAMDDKARQDAGRSIPYRAVATLGQATGVADPVSMERSADTGDVGGILGSAGTSAAIAAAPYIAKGLGAAKGAVGDVMREREHDSATGCGNCGKMARENLGFPLPI